MLKQDLLTGNSQDEALVKSNEVQQDSERLVDHVTENTKQKLGRLAGELKEVRLAQESKRDSKGMKMAYPEDAVDRLKELPHDSNLFSYRGSEGKTPVYFTKRSYDDDPDTIMHEGPATEAGQPYVDSVREFFDEENIADRDEYRSGQEKISQLESELRVVGSEIEAQRHAAQGFLEFLQEQAPKVIDGLSPEAFAAILDRYNAIMNKRGYAQVAKIGIEFGIERLQEYVQGRKILHVGDLVEKDSMISILDNPALPREVRNSVREELNALAVNQYDMSQREANEIVRNAWGRLSEAASEVVNMSDQELSDLISDTKVGADQKLAAS